MTITNPQHPAAPETKCKTCGLRPVHIKIRGLCKACNQRAWAKRNPNYFRNCQRRRYIGLSLEERLEMLTRGFDCTLLELLTFIWTTRIKNQIRVLEDERAQKAQAN